MEWKSTQLMGVDFSHGNGSAGPSGAGLRDEEAVIFGRRVRFPTPEAPPCVDPRRIDRAASPPDFSVRLVDSSDLPTIDVSIVTYGSEKWVEGFRESLIRQAYPLNKLALYITDHSPDDSCVEVLRQALEPVRNRFHELHIERRQNRGFGTGHNGALAAGRSAFILVTNIDVTFEPDTLCALVHEALADSGRTASFECFQKPYEHPKIYDAVTGETPWSSSACILFRRRALEEVCGYDERFFMYGEDVDLSFRLRDRGWILKYCPRAVVWHYTYERAGEVKEMQFFGGVLADMYLRLRFASACGILQGIIEQGKLLLVSHGFAEHKRKLLRNWRIMLVNAAHFLRSRKRSTQRFPIGKSQYAPHRMGAFYRFASLPPLKERPLISVIVRTYPGRAPLLREAVLSVCNQTYRPVEIIIVEDGGDTCRSVVCELRLLTDIDIVYYAAEKTGRCVTGNLGLVLSQGALLCFLDDDDHFLADHLEVLAEALRKAPEAPAAFGYAWEVRTAYPPQGWVPYRTGEPRQALNQSFERFRLWSHNFLPIQCVLFRRGLYETFGGFCTAMERLEDWELWQRYSLAGDFIAVEKTTSLYHTTADPVQLRLRDAAMRPYNERMRQRQHHMAAFFRLDELREEMTNYSYLHLPLWRLVHQRLMRRLQSRPVMLHAYLSSGRAGKRAFNALRTTVRRTRMTSSSTGDVRAVPASRGKRHARE